MKFKPLHDRLAVRRVEQDEKAAGGILIPDAAKEKPMQGEVVAVSPGERGENGKLHPLDVRPGDRVLGRADEEAFRRSISRCKFVGQEHRTPLNNITISFPCSGLRVLLVEDERLITTRLIDTLTAHGHQIVGPFSTAEEALEAADCGQVDVAVLCVWLRSELVYPLAESLTERGVPVMFISSLNGIVRIPRDLRVSGHVAW